MSLASGVSDLATRIAGYLKTNVLPRLIPAGGTSGQVLTKSSATDYAVTWTTPSSSGGGGGLTAAQARAISRKTVFRYTVR